MESTFLEFLHKKQLIHDLPTRQVVEHWSHLERSGLARLWRAGDIAADDLANAAAEFYGLPRITYSNVSTSPPLHQNLSQRFLREAFVFPFDYQGTLTLAVADPTVTDALEAVRLALGQPVSLAVVSFEEIELLFEQVEINEPASRDAIGVLKRPDRMIPSQKIWKLSKTLPVALQSYVPLTRFSSEDYKLEQQTFTSRPDGRA
jgi:general secretion pathway protein E